MLQSCFSRAVVTILQLSVLQWYSRVEQKAHEKEDSHGSSAQLDSCFLWLDSLAKQYNLIILASRWFTAKVSRELSFYELSVLRNRMLWTRIIPCTRRIWCNSIWICMHHWYMGTGDRMCSVGGLSWNPKSSSCSSSFPARLNTKPIAGGSKWWRIE